jgi:hypothetical protein
MGKLSNRPSALNPDSAQTTKFHQPQPSHLKEGLGADEFYIFKPVTSL